jgi:hypothetical protein
MYASLVAFPCVVALTYPPAGALLASAVRATNGGANVKLVASGLVPVSPW